MGISPIGAEACVDVFTEHRVIDVRFGWPQDEEGTREDSIPTPSYGEGKEKYRQTTVAAEEDVAEAACGESPALGSTAAVAADEDPGHVAPVDDEEEAQEYPGIVAPLRASEAAPPQPVVAQGTPGLQEPAETPNASRFYDGDYRTTLRAITLEVVDREGPITFAYLCERVARLHGFQRTGSRIRDAITGAIRGTRTQTKGGPEEIVVWPEGSSPQRWLSFRRISDRPWGDVPLPEKLGLARAVIRDGGDDLETAMRQQIGMARLRTRTRVEIADLLSQAKAQLHAEPEGSGGSGNVSYLDLTHLKPRGRTGY